MALKEGHDTVVEVAGMDMGARGCMRVQRRDAQKHTRARECMDTLIYSIVRTVRQR